MSNPQKCSSEQTKYIDVYNIHRIIYRAKIIYTYSLNAPSYAWMSKKTKIYDFIWFFQIDIFKCLAQKFLDDQHEAFPKANPSKNVQKSSDISKLQTSSWFRISRGITKNPSRKILTRKRRKTEQDWQKKGTHACFGSEMQSQVKMYIRYSTSLRGLRAYKYGGVG